MINDQTLRHLKEQLGRGLISQEQFDRLSGKLEAWKPWLTSKTTVEEVERKHPDWRGMYGWERFKTALKDGGELWNYESPKYEMLDQYIGLVVVHGGKVVADFPMMYPYPRPLYQ